MPTVLVTGANRGLGLEFARQYAAAGWRVFATCRDPERADDLRALSGDVQVHPLDVADFDAIARLGRELRGEPIDLLLLNAGRTQRPSGLGEVDYEVWGEIFRVNAIAPIRLAEALIDNVAASPGKRIVAISSRLGSIAYTEPDDRSWAHRGAYYPYRTSKAALNMAMRALAAEVRERGIVAIAICPGWVKTDMGGADATYDAPAAIAQLRDVFARLTPADSGLFLSHEGEPYAW